MSAIGTKRTSACALHMSAFGGKADMRFAPQMSAYDPKRTFSAIVLIQINDAPRVIIEHYRVKGIR